MPVNSKESTPRMAGLKAGVYFEIPTVQRYKSIVTGIDDLVNILDLSEWRDAVERLEIKHSTSVGQKGGIINPIRSATWWLQCGYAAQTKRFFCIFFGTATNIMSSHMRYGNMTRLSRSTV